MYLANKIKSRLYSVWDNYIVTDTYKSRKAFRDKFGFEPNLTNPESFSEKIQWLKLNYRLPGLHNYVDKYQVREYVESTVGQKYLNDLIGVWDNANHINIDDMPGKFVIKANHGSGMNLICHDKAAIDWDWEKKILNRQLARNYYRSTREWAYRNVIPRLIGEKFLSCDGKSPKDYKIYCFNGKPRMIIVDCDRFEAHRQALFDENWNPLPVTYRYQWPDEIPPAPENLEEQLYVAEKLASKFPFVRVDLYDFSSRVYFGELTFYPGNGVERFTPMSWDKKIGNWLTLP